MYLRWAGEDEEATTTHCAGSYRLLKKKSAQRKFEGLKVFGTFTKPAHAGWIISSIHPTLLAVWVGVAVAIVALTGPLTLALICFYPCHDSFFLPPLRACFANPTTTLKHSQISPHPHPALFPHY
jgi:hypothetical protein